MLSGLQKLAAAEQSWSFTVTGFKAFLLRTDTKALVKWSAPLPYSSMERQIKGEGCGVSLPTARERQKARLKVPWKQEEERALVI